MLTASLIERLRGQVTLPCWCREVRSVDEALVRLADVLERGDATSLSRRAREAFIAALALAQMLNSASSRLARPSEAPGPNRRAMEDVLDALDPYVTRQDRNARQILLGGEPLDAVLERIFIGARARATLR